MDQRIRTNSIAAAGKALHDALRPGLLRYSVAWFLGALALMFVTLPFVEGVKNGELIEAVLLTLVLTSALLAVGGRRRTLIGAFVLVTPALLCKWLTHLRPDLVPPEAAMVAASAYVLFVAIRLLWYILAAQQINSEVLCAGVATYLLIALLWGLMYILVARLIPGAFVFTAGEGAAREMRGFTALYFSFTTLTTVGFGDIVPVVGVARMLAMSEAVTGSFYLAVMISRLVSLYKPGRAGKGADGAAS